MATGFLVSSGADLDDVFDPYVTGTSPSATGFQLSSGTDINTRYAPIVFGSSAAPTGFQLSSGADLNTLFAAKNTAAYWPSVLVWGDAFGQNVPSGTAEVILTFNTSGDCILERSGVPSVNLGRYLPIGAAASDFVIRSSLLSGVAASATNISGTNQSLNTNRFVRYTTTTERDGSYNITISRASNLSDNRSATSAFTVVVGGGV
jgi:hypothetical protein